MSCWFHCILFMLACAVAAAAEEIPSGLYALKEDDSGQRVVRADTDGHIFLGQRLGPILGPAALVSATNDNERFRLSARAGALLEGAHRQRLGAVIAGRCVPVSSHSDRESDGTISFGASVRGEASANAIAEELEIEPVLRGHPGHQLLVNFRSENPSYRLGEPVTLIMTIRNVGPTAIRFYDGGMQRGARNNQFGFIAFHNSWPGTSVPDRGDPRHEGGLMGLVELAPQEHFEKSVSLSDWFKFDEAGGYAVTGMYRLTLLDPTEKQVLWEDFAVADCGIRIE